MITVLYPLDVEQHRDGYWELVFYLGEWFDQTIPFRAVLSEMVSILSHHASTELIVPKYEVGEDFIEGCLHFGVQEIRVYFEYSLGYLSLSCPDQKLLGEVWAVLKSSVTVG